MNQKLDIKVSVIVPVFNAERTLSKCVHSLLDQDFDGFEVILVDDGSTDGCPAICDTFSQTDSRVRVIHQSNAGVAMARQVGLVAALGEYTIHADSDDWVDQGMLSTLYAKAKETNADMVICDFFVNSYKGQEYIKQQPHDIDDNNAIIKELFGRLHGSTCNKLIRRSFYKQYNVRFPEQISFCEDQYVIISLLLHPIKVAYLPQAFYHYVRGDVGSLSKSYSRKMLEQDKIALKLFAALVADTPMRNFVKAQKARFMMGHAFWWGDGYFTSNMFKEEFSKYLPLLRNVEMSKAERVLLRLSCSGFYSAIRNIVGVAMSIKRLVVISRTIHKG